MSDLVEKEKAKSVDKLCWYLFQNMIFQYLAKRTVEWDIEDLLLII